jgi:SAM-dependent methyltransferase
MIEEHREGKRTERTLGRGSRADMQQNIEKEKEWHTQRFYIDSGHWTSHPLFASRERHWLKNCVEKIRFYACPHKLVRSRKYGGNAIILLAPVGDGNDVQYLQGMFSEVHGIDLSSVALENCPNIIIKKEGDLIDSGYQDCSFDIIVCSLFLHHVHKVGFDPFLKEFYRILRDGGTLAILEPSCLYPLSWMSAALTTFLGNVTGKMEDERPISPFVLNASLKRVGFKNIVCRGVTFNHVRFPWFFQSILNIVDYPFRMVFPMNIFSETMGWYCTKPERKSS